MLPTEPNCIAIKPIEIVITGQKREARLRARPGDPSFFERTSLRRLMDARIKPGHDRWFCGTRLISFAHTPTSQSSNRKTNPDVTSRLATRCARAVDESFAP